MSTPSFDKGPRPGEPPAPPSAPAGDGHGYGAPSSHGAGSPSPLPYGATPYGTTPYGTVPYGTTSYATPPGSPLPYGAPYGGASPVEGPGGEWIGPPLASWSRRVGATLVDVLVLLALGLVGGIVAGIASVGSQSLGILLIVLTYAGVFAFSAWQLVVQGRTGQTIGKKAVGIRLVRLRDGQPVGPGLSIGRYFVHLLDAYSLLLGYLWPLWDKKNQTFADKCLSTVVLKV